MAIEIIPPFDRTAKGVPIVFVHGAWHGAWCWEEYFLPHFRQMGYQAHAFNLTGHGTSKPPANLRWIPLKTYLEDLIFVVERFEQPPFVVGHSMGGFLVAKLIETCTVRGAVLMGAVPPHGALKTGWQLIQNFPHLTLKSLFTLSLKPFISNSENVWQALYSPKTPLNQVKRFAEQMQDESLRVFLDMVLTRAHKRKNQTPVLVLGATEDRLVTPSEVHHTADFYGTEAIFFQEMGHAMMLERNWREVADCMLDWMKHQET